MHLFFSFLGFILPKTDQKRMIYVIWKKKPQSHNCSKYIYLIIVKKTVFNQFFELDDEQDGLKAGDMLYSAILLHDTSMVLDGRV